MVNRNVLYFMQNLLLRAHFSSTVSEHLSYPSLQTNQHTSVRDGLSIMTIVRPGGSSAWTACTYIDAITCWRPSVIPEDLWPQAFVDFQNFLKGCWYRDVNGVWGRSDSRHGMQIFGHVKWISLILHAVWNLQSGKLTNEKSVLLESKFENI